MAADDASGDVVDVVVETFVVDAEVVLVDVDGAVLADVAALVVIDAVTVVNEAVPPGATGPADASPPRSALSPPFPHAEPTSSPATAAAPVNRLAATRLSLGVRTELDDESAR